MNLEGTYGVMDVSLLGEGICSLRGGGKFFFCSSVSLDSWSKVEGIFRAVFFHSIPCSKLFLFYMPFMFVNCYFIICG